MEGQNVAHYEIKEKLGGGGMGVVYRAIDTRLGRPVALKFLPEEYFDNQQARERFHREARSASALSHPNICTIYELGDSHGQPYLSMEFLHGKTLKHVIEERSLAISEVLALGIQVAAGLQAAHTRGIIHRDIKPANIFLTNDGQIKILDFGIAKVVDNRSTQDALTRVEAGEEILTRPGTIIGTTPYMSPEQVRGELLDGRTDLFSFGVVLYEMATGRRPFDDRSTVAVLGQILTQTPTSPLELNPELPIGLEPVINKALEKDREFRYQTASDLLVDLKRLERRRQTGLERSLETQSPLGAAPEQRYEVPTRTQFSRASRESPMRRYLFWTVLAFLAVAVGLIVNERLRVPSLTTDLPLRKFAYMAEDRPRWPVISPNGKHIAYVTGAGLQSQLWVLELETGEARPLADPDGLGHPFWSPSSDQIGLPGSRGISVVPIRGGQPRSLCKYPAPPEEPESQSLDTFPETDYASPTGFSGTWAPDGGTIVFSSGPPFRLYTVPVGGGTPQSLVDLEQTKLAGDFVYPQFLPSVGGTNKLVFVLFNANGAQLILLDPETGQQRVLGNGALPVYSPSGHLLFQTDFETHDLWALPFSAENSTVTGEGFRVSENASHPSVAGDGTLVYLATVRNTQDQLIWRDRRGREVGIIGQPQDEIFAPTLSPGGLQVAVRGWEGDNFDIWIHETTRALKTRVTFDTGVDYRPLWYEGGKKLIFSSTRRGTVDIFSKEVERSGDANFLWGTPGLEEYGTYISAEGKYLVYTSVDAQKNFDIGYLQRIGASDQFKATPFVKTASEERSGELSPDGKFLAYVSDESGRPEVYVERFPEGGGRQQISANGGDEPRWRSDGRELFYVEDGTLLSASIRTDSGLQVMEITRLFNDENLLRTGGRDYDVSKDGERFVLIKTTEKSKSPPIRVVQNWVKEFR